MSKDITNEQLFEFMTKMHGEMQEIKVEIQKGFKEVKNEIKKTNTKIDHEVMPKIDALFDGHKQNADKLDRIEKEVSIHEEIILRRIKQKKAPMEKIQRGFLDYLPCLNV